MKLKFRILTPKQKNIFQELVRDLNRDQMIEKFENTL